MKTSITYTLGVFAMLVAVMCGVVNLTSDRHSKDHHNPQLRPMRTVSTLGEERRSTKRSERVHNPESEFQKHLSKIKPITAFEEPSDGYFQAYLLARNAESLLSQGEQANTTQAVLEQFEKSYAYFLGVQETAPDWKVQMVLERLEKTKSSLREAYFASNTQR
ncbi:MAG: hypothetical protein V4689_11320 [Verrucomicrobiota bacterium]